MYSQNLCKYLIYIEIYNHSIYDSILKYKMIQKEIINLRKAHKFNFKLVMKIHKL